MDYYLIFDVPNRYEWGYERTSNNVENLKKLIGKRICYITPRNVDSRRGMCFTRFGKVTKVTGRKLFIDSGDIEIKITEILEIGVEKDS